MDQKDNQVNESRNAMLPPSAPHPGHVQATEQSPDQPAEEKPQKLSSCCWDTFFDTTDCACCAYIGADYCCCSGYLPVLAVIAAIILALTMPGG